MAPLPGSPQFEVSMSAGFMDTSEENQKLILRWTAAGHEVIHDRMVFRHKLLRKDLAPDALVRFQDGSPIISHGKSVRVSDLLPERADVALDGDGKLFGETEFTKRYHEYARWFQYVEGTDLSCEPVPDPLTYILATPDTFSESPGFVEIHYDARKPAEQEATHKYDPIRDQMVEITEAQKTQGKAIEVLLEQVLEKRGPGRPRKEEA